MAIMIIKGMETETTEINQNMGTNQSMEMNPVTTMNQRTKIQDIHNPQTPGIRDKKML